MHVKFNMAMYRGILSERMVFINHECTFLFDHLNAVKISVTYEYL